MKKIFKVPIKDRFFSVMFSFIYIIAFLLFVNLNIFSSDLNIFRKIGGLLILIWIVFIILKYLSVLTYRITIENEVISDWDFLHKKRILKIDEIQYVRLASYSYPYFRGRGSFGTKESFGFINEKFKKFPRYAVSPELGNFMKDNYNKGAF